MENAELLAILQEVRDRVRARHPQTAAGPVDIALPDLLPLVHARDAAMGKVAAIGTVNPRAGGPLNWAIQTWKRLLARVLDWHVREQVEFNRKIVACVDAALEALNDNNRAMDEAGGVIASLAARIAAEEKLGAAGRRQFEEEFGDIRKHWAEWRGGWEEKLARNEIQFLRSVADLQGAFQHRATLMDASYRETVRGQHADFEAALERSVADIQKRLWADLERARVEFDRLIFSELRLIRQRAQLGGAGSGSPLPPGPEPAMPTARPAPPAFDPARFAERFRGSPEHVKAAQRIYLPDFTGCQEVLDIGCGRGEFLETMREAGVPARGIDFDAEAVGACRLKGLAAETADLFAYLTGLPEASLDGIFCAQVVEHLPPERLPEMIRLCASRLARRGVIAIETHNPECLAIFATHFYLDPTHQRPVPPPLLAFYLEEYGVGSIAVRRLAPAVESMPSLGSLPEDFREAFFVGLDYAIVGRKL